jgi:DNA segregation ATPase FtsK/SpoIIIE, S-DNA-T family
MTLLDPQRVDAQVDVAIDAPAGTPLSAVSENLAATLGVTARGPRTPGPRFRCDRRPVEETQPLGLPPLLHGAVLTIDSGQAPAAQDRAPTLLEAHVTAGPDAGATVSLPLGRHTIGRGPGNLIQLTDPDASRIHAELTVGANGMQLRDAGSMNGTRLHGRPLRSAPEPVQLGDEIRIGSGVLTVRGPERPPAVALPDAAGQLRINRRPILRPTRTEAEIHFPTAPPDRPASRVPWLTMLLPLLLAVPLAAIWKQPTMLLFTLLTPLMMGAQYLADRRTGRREAAERRARHELITARREQEVELAVAADAAHLHATRPDLARLIITATTPTDELWPRSPADDDFLTLRLGRGPESSQVTVIRPEPDDLEHVRRPGRFIHPDVPVAVNLARVGVLGICGPRASALGLARSLIGQIAVLHSPHDVRIEVLHADPEQRRDWRWTNWLPHHDRPRAVAGTDGRSPRNRPGPDHGIPDDRSRRVIVLDGAHRLRRRPELAHLLSRAAEARVAAPTEAEPVPLVLCLDQVEQALPVECGATVTLGGDNLTGADPLTGAVLRCQGAAPSRFVPDLASARWSERLARRTAAFRDATPVTGQDLPAALSLMDLLTDADGVRAADPDDLVRHWRRSAHPAPSATLGRAATGPFRIDLRRDGPHVLVGGTTGAGKSELLQTLVAALAVGNSPDSMSFLLVDYKGGAAFRECAALPHVGGVITDLDPALARRALASLTAELRRRERILHSVAATDIDGYHRTRNARPQLAALPRLVVIVDEFRVLAEELPDFISGLIRTATVGRSLGVHLVLATQRPAGVVSAEISANVNLRIALRVRDAADSRDLVDDPGAARLPVDRPGRALARIGADPLAVFQTARVSGHGSDRTTRTPTVRCLDHAEGTSSPPSGVESNATVAERTDLSRITRAATVAAQQLNLSAVQQLWLPPLPSRLQLIDVLDLDTAVDPRPGTDAAACTQLPFALLDLPDQQHQEALAWRLDGHLAIAGGPRSGRTTALLTIARVTETVTARGELHIYALDGAGSLTELNHLHRVEAVIAVHDSERSERLLRLLSDEIGARQQDGPFLPGGDASPACRRPDIVLLIDGWEALVSSWNNVDHGRPIDQLTAVLRDGTAVGVYAAVTGGRSLLTGAVGALLTERVVLRFADPADAVLAGVPTSQLSRSQPPGRGLFIGPRFPDAVELQVAHSDPHRSAADIGRSGAGAVRPLAVWTSPGVPVTRSDRAPLAAPVQTPDERGSAAVGRSRDRRSRRPVQPPASRLSWRLPELPRRLEYSQLMDAWRVHPASPGAPIDPDRLCVPIGIGGDEALPVTLDLDSTPITLVVGPAGSGRTTALHCIADGLRRAGEPMVWVCLAGAPRRTRIAGPTPIPGRPPRVLGTHHSAPDPDTVNPHAQLARITPGAHLASPMNDHVFPVPQAAPAGQVSDCAPAKLRAPRPNGDESRLNGRAPYPHREPWIDGQGLFDDGRFAFINGDTPFIDGAEPTAAAALAVVLAARPTATVLVDDTMPTGIPGPVQDQVADLLTSRVGSGRMVVASSGAELLGAYRGLLSIAKTGRSGVLLSPGAPGEAEVFGLRPSHRPAGPPGRALLVDAGQAIPVQLALPSCPDQRRSGEKLDP